MTYSSRKDLITVKDRDAEAIAATVGCGAKSLAVQGQTWAMAGR